MPTNNSKTDQERVAAEFNSRYGGPEDESYGPTQALSYLIVLGAAFAGKAVKDGTRRTRAKIAKLIG